MAADERCTFAAVARAAGAVGDDGAERVRTQADAIGVLLSSAEPLVRGSDARGGRPAPAGVSRQRPNQLDLGVQATRLDSIGRRR